ncbi:MAG: FadR/GntR family transcriptional regulator [Pseudomonadota bacterium]
MTDRLYRSIADRLRGRIARNTYVLAERLPGERELADEFGVSRVTIREALIALQAMGYIDIRPGSGAYVARQQSSSRGDVPPVSALELTQARLMFESEAAALAAREIDDDALDRLASLVSVMSRAHANGDHASLEADREFHLTISRASGNAAVHHTIEQLWRMRMELNDVQEAHTAVCGEEMAVERGCEHERILAALKARDPSAARNAMQDHFTRLLASLIDASEARALAALRDQTALSRERFLNVSKSTDN